MVELDLKSERIGLSTLIGFLTMFAALVMAYANLKNDSGNAAAFAENQRSENTRIFRRLETMDEVKVDILARLDRLEFQVERLEESVDNINAQMVLVGENYTARLDALGSSLGQLNLELAIANQTLARLSGSSRESGSGLAPDEVGRR